VVDALIRANFEPVIASDGNALELLRKEFPSLKSYKLPSYNIHYTKKGKSLKLRLLFRIPSIISIVNNERKRIHEIIEKEKIKGLISDNRLGVYSNKIPSVYITHQLNVLSGNTTFLTSKIHQRIIQKYDECWVPDTANSDNLTGVLGHLKGNRLSVNYMGIVSRFQFRKSDIKYDLLVLLSGPEPQRTTLESKLLTELRHYKGSVLVVRGVLSKQNSIVTPSKFKVVDYMLTGELEEAINQSNVVIARSGYSTIMDLAVLEKKAFLIPTPGQFEQQYLAERMNEKKITPFCRQEDFSIDKLEQTIHYTGFKKGTTSIDLELFKLFDGK
jgi:UDP:flavonoid glycosyltransferase YjiC (YdhE family)